MKGSEETSSQALHKQRAPRIVGNREQRVVAPPGPNFRRAWRVRLIRQHLPSRFGSWAFTSRVSGHHGSRLWGWRWRTRGNDATQLTKRQTLLLSRQESWQGPFGMSVFRGGGPVFAAKAQARPMAVMSENSGRANRRRENRTKVAPGMPVDSNVRLCDPWMQSKPEGRSLAR